MEGEHAARTRLRIETIREVGFDAGRFVQERQRPAPGGQAGGQTLGITTGLRFDAGEGRALLLGLDHAAGTAIDIQQVVGGAMAFDQRKFADRNAVCGVQIDLGEILHRPAGGAEQRVDGLPGRLLGREGALSWRHDRSPAGTSSVIHPLRAVDWNAMVRNGPLPWNQRGPLCSRRGATHQRQRKPVPMRVGSNLQRGGPRRTRTSNQRIMSPLL